MERIWLYSFKNEGGTIHINLLVHEKFNNSGQIKGNFLEFLEHDLINKGSINFKQFAFLPNLKEVHNSGKLYAHILFVNEDAATCFNPTQYDKLVVIPHHEIDWTEEQCDDYLLGYSISHPTDFIL